MLNILLSVLLAAQATSPQVALTLSSDEKAGWGVIATGHGNVMQGDASTLAIHLDDLSLQANPAFPADRGIKSIKLCLAEPWRKTWRPVACSSKLELDASMKSGDVITKKDLSFSVGVPKGAQLSSFWLVLDMESLYQISKKRGSWYAASEGDPLQELQDLLPPPEH